MENIRKDINAFGRFEGANGAVSFDRPSEHCAFDVSLRELVLKPPRPKVGSLQKCTGSKAEQLRSKVW